MAVKVWPLTLLAGMAPGQWRRGVAAAAAVLVVVCAVFAGGTASFLAHQNARGVEIEAVAATPFMIWRLAGWHGTVMYRFGAWQLSGGHVALAQDASRLSLVLAAAAVIGWRLLIAVGRARWRPEFAADAPLAATLLFLVASPVLSPQYLLWVIGLAATCLATGRTTQRPVALAVLAAAGLTQVIFPTGWHGLLDGSDAVTGVLAARNVLLVVAAALSCWRIGSAISPGYEDPYQGLPSSGRSLSRGGCRNDQTASASSSPERRGSCLQLSRCGGARFPPRMPWLGGSDPRPGYRRVDDAVLKPGVAAGQHATCQRRVGGVCVAPQLAKQLLGTQLRLGAERPANSTATEPRSVPLAAVTSSCARTHAALMANSSAPMSTIRPRKPCLCSSRPCHRAIP